MTCEPHFRRLARRDLLRWAGAGALVGLGACARRGSGGGPGVAAPPGVPWPVEVQDAALAVERAWGRRITEQPEVVLVDEARWAGAGYSDDQPAVTTGLRVVTARGAREDAAGSPRVRVLLHPAVDRLSPEERGLVLRHELAHCLLDREIPAAEPWWWREGLAEWVAHRPTGSQPRGEGEGLTERQRDYARSLATVAQLHRVGGRELLQQVDAAWGTPQLPGPTGLPRFLARRGLEPGDLPSTSGLRAD
ncbi:hypothetical protein SAMN05445756_0334 [Kytococcus aerolatus]|uniref:Peptidase MA superfamily protein n=1 Tax=Kytococcus aerolatus TaxID=592308 RepID=A0A212T4D1_9MICO|nr:hypothetical protein [Kytococcus aerolatus]SNC60710.1 hypothetical protein SAMN05445756_0334 [Kytococcus aerolatus]